MLATAISGADVTCAENEYLRMNPPAGQSCGEYLSPYISEAGGYLLNANATSDCSYCRVRDTNTFLASVDVDPANSWRNFGFMWIYIVFNFVAAIFFYWLGRVPKNLNHKRDATSIVESGVTTPPSGDPSDTSLKPAEV